MLPATSYSSTTPARGSPSSIQQTAKCAMPRSSSRCWVHRTTPTLKRPGRRRCPTGSRRMCACSASLAARPYRPRDKAKVESGVRFAQTYILGRLRHQTFFSLADANRAIVRVLERMNGHVMRRLGLSRHDLFASVERPALRVLPAIDYEFAEWRLARVGLDYHVEVEGFYYSVPHALIRAQVDLRITNRIIEVFHRGKRVAAHQRRYGGRRHGTDPTHMPSAHRRYAAWSPARFQRWAHSIGPSTEALVIAVLANRPHP